MGIYFMEPVNNYDKYNLLEETILTKIQELIKAHIGDREVVYGPNDPRTLEINRVVSELIKDFPCDDRGNRFLGCQLVLKPIVVISVTKLTPIEAGKMIHLPNIGNERFGTYINEQIVELRNITALPGQSIHNLKIAEDAGIKPKMACEGVMINSSMGVKDTPGRIKVVADITIGSHSENVEFEAEIDQVNQEVFYHIPMPIVQGKINYDRWVQLSNGKSGMLEDFGYNIYGGGASIGTPFNLALCTHFPSPLP